MKKLFLALLCTGLLFAACNKDDETGDGHNHDGPYEVTVEIMHPMEGAMIELDSSVHVHVNFNMDEGKTIHIVKIQVLDANDVVVETLEEKHAHVETTYTYHNMQAFTPTVAGAYKIKALSAADDGTELEPVYRNFTVQ